MHNACSFLCLQLLPILTTVLTLFCAYAATTTAPNMTLIQTTPLIEAPTPSASEAMIRAEVVSLSVALLVATVLLLGESPLHDFTEMNWFILKQQKNFFSDIENCILNYIIVPNTIMMTVLLQQ